MQAPFGAKSQLPANHADRSTPQMGVMNIRNVRGVIASAHATESVVRARRIDLRRGYFGAALLAAVIVFIGFAPSYYLKGFADSRPLSPLLHVHGAVMTAWFALFTVQTWLVAAHRVDWHRHLGIVGAVLAVLVVVTGVAVAIEGARLGHAPPGRMEPLKFLVVPLSTAFMFGVLIGAALVLRHRREMHRRLMLLATLAILTPAIARLLLLAGPSFAGVPAIVFAIALTDLAIAAFVVSDVTRTRRLHPAFAWGCTFIVAAQVLRLPFAATSQWLAFAEWLTR
jgi:hypothetical protein